MLAEDVVVVAALHHVQPVLIVACEYATVMQELRDTPHEALEFGDVGEATTDLDRFGLPVLFEPPRPRPTSRGANQKTACGIAVACGQAREQ